MYDCQQSLQGSQLPAEIFVKYPGAICKITRLTAAKLSKFRRRNSCQSLRFIQVKLPPQE